jgi:cytochrome c peroxidase
LDFIVTAANPLAQRVASAREQLEIDVPPAEQPFRARAVTLFDTGAFAPEAFAPPGTEAASPARVELGRKLFFDLALSGDGKRSCSSCHDPKLAFTDGAARSSTRAGHRVLRNAPTILNAGLQLGAFYDQRARYLEDQVADVVGNPNEMGGNLDAAAGKLARDRGYDHLFAAAFGSSEDSVMNARHLREAVAAYIRSLQTLNSPVDRALRGDTSALSREERLGFNVFTGRGRCATCHFLPLTNGVMPPMYIESEVEVLGVPDRAVVQHARIDPDSGRFKFTRVSPHLHAFKVPTLRNVALTAPYMHNGVYRTLEEVVDFYNRGGGAGIGIDLPNQTLPRDSLGLSLAEQKALVVFMRALTDTAGTLPPRRN